MKSYLPSNYFNVSIFRWSLCHFYEIIRLLLCFFSGLYFPPKHYGEKYKRNSNWEIDDWMVRTEVKISMKKKYSGGRRKRNPCPMRLWLRQAIVSLFFNSTYPVNYIAKEIFWTEIYQGRLLFRAEIYRGRLFLGAKQEGLTIVHFLNNCYQKTIHTIQTFDIKVYI
jgi:hypothetical protein